MRLVKLTTEKGQTVYISADRIAYCLKDFPEARGCTVQTDKEYFHVRESPEEIEAMANS
jgi:hypothetical protein